MLRIIFGSTWRETGSCHRTSHIVALQAWAAELPGSADVATQREPVAAAKDETLGTNDDLDAHQELSRLLRELVAEGKFEMQRFRVTPQGLFDKLWEALMSRSDISNAVEARYTARLTTTTEAARLHHEDESQDEVGTSAAAEARALAQP